MQLKHEDLADHLQRGVKALYVVHGDEPLLALEAGDAIRAAARAAGVVERDVLVVEPGFKWDAFLGANANASLFGDRKFVDLRIPSGKPGVEGGKALEAYAANPNPDNVTLVTLPRLDRATQSSAWFSAMAGAGVTVAVYPVDRDALPGWIAARLARQRQRATRETLTFLAEACEGNLLAARQEIEKLALLLPEGELAHDAVEAAVADVARFDIFELSEAWLAGDAARAVRILRALEAEGEAPTLAIWQLVRGRARACGRHDARALRHARLRRRAQRARVGQAAARARARGAARARRPDRAIAVGDRAARRAVERHRSRQRVGRTRDDGAGAGGQAGVAAACEVLKATGAKNNRARLGLFGRGAGSRRRRRARRQ